MKEPIDIEKMIAEHRKIKSMMNEMAMPLKVYIRKIEYYMYELARNWCLCKWCQMFDLANVNFNHWKKELGAFMDQFSAPVIKNKVDKRKHLHKHLIDYNDFNDKDMILKIINPKFNEEDINSQKQKEAVAQLFAENIDALIDVLASTPDACDTYIRAEFKAM